MGQSCSGPGISSSFDFVLKINKNGTLVGSLHGALTMDHPSSGPEIIMEHFSECS